MKFDDVVRQRRSIRGYLKQPVPKAFILPIVVMLVGFFTMLISVQPGAPRLIALPGWLISWVGMVLVLKGNSAVVRIGGGFVLSLLMMALAVSCG